MPNYNSDQTSYIINLPDRSGSAVMNNSPGENKPDEQVPPIEVPGRTDVPEDIPEKSTANKC